MVSGSDDFTLFLWKPWLPRGHAQGDIDGGDDWVVGRPERKTDAPDTDFGGGDGGGGEGGGGVGGGGDGGGDGGGGDGGGGDGDAQLHVAGTGGGKDFTR